MSSNGWTRLAGVLAAGMAVGTILFTAAYARGGGDVASRRPDLTGVIQGEDGKPLRDARVFIYTAGPKEGVGILCPSCYADCRKRARTDRAGAFKIESLDPTLLFRVLVVATGHRPKFVGKVDPALKTLNVKLKRNLEAVSPNQQLKGHVLDSDGEPLGGAVVSIRGITRGQSTRYGGNEDVDPLAVSDDSGAFLINGTSSFDAASVEVDARGYAKRTFEHLVTGGKVHELMVTEGGVVKGRLKKDGLPLAGVEMGICGANRAAGSYVGDFSVGTDKEGRFLFANLPPNCEYFLYGKMSSLGSKGAVPAQRVRVWQDGTIEDVKDISVVAGFTLAGQIRLTDGKLVPPRTRVMLSREEAWDSAQTETDAAGRFKFVGVPAENLNLSTRVKGYRLSAHNKSLDTSNPFRLVGMLKTDKTNLVVELEPGSDRQFSPGNYIDLSHEPLVGAEAARIWLKGR